MRFLIPLALAGLLAAATESDYQKFDGRAMLGVNMIPPSQPAQDRNGTDPNTGVEVNTVYSGTAAEQSGIKNGDLIVAINGGDIHSMNDLRNEVALVGVGGDVTVSVLRNGQPVQVTGTIGVWPANIPYAPIDDNAERQFRDWQRHRLDRTQEAANNLGKQVEDLERKLAKQDQPVAKLPPQDAVLLPASEALRALPAWHVTVRMAHDELPIKTAKAAPEPRTAWDARVLLGTPAPRIF